MVRQNTLKINILDSLATFTIIISLIFVPFIINKNASAAASCNTVSGTTTCTDTTTFNVNVTEVLTVSITSPQTWASGTINTLLTNKVGVSVISNNPAGFTATMKTSSTTPNLVNTLDNTMYIPTLTSTATLADSADSTNLFPVNQWGYSIVNGSASAPSEYYAMAGSGDTPIQIAHTTTAAAVQAKDIYFAAKADNAKASGTYESGVIISVVSGVVTTDSDEPNNNPVTPATPATPVDTNTTNPDVAYEPSKGNPTNTTNPSSEVTVQAGTTTYTETSTDNEAGTSTTYSEILPGDTRSSYSGPAGVTTATINEGTPLATGLAVTAGIAAVTGIAFFVAAKRHNTYDEDDDEDF